MTPDEIGKFLAAHADVPLNLRRAIVFTHGQDRPRWCALTLTRGVSQIVEIARCRRRAGARSFTVLRWFWNDRSFGLSWTACRTMRAARACQEQMFSVDHAHLGVRA